MLFRTVDSTDDAPNLEPIWGNWLFKNCVVEQVGEPGISKSSFNYAFISALLNRQPFLGVDGVKALQTSAWWILYLDLESSESLIKARKNMLDVLPNDKFTYCNYPNGTIMDLEPFIDAEVRKRKELSQDLAMLYVDPMRMAFRLKDENDNAEASSQMKYLRQLSRQWGCVIVLVHHSSKAELGGTRKGSGAYARAALADIIWNFERLGDDYDPDLFKFHIPKSRYIQDDFCVCVKKNSGTFEISDFPAGYKAKSMGIKVYTLQQSCVDILEDGYARGPHDIMEDLKKKKNTDVTRQGVHKALTALIQLGLVKKVDYGKYILIQNKL